MNYSSTDNSVWCTNRYTERSEEIPFCLKLFSLVSSHTFVSCKRRDTRRIKNFQRPSRNVRVAQSEFYERVNAFIRLLSHPFIRHYILKWERSIDRYRSDPQRRAILWPRVATRAVSLIKHRVHIGNNGCALNHVKRQSFPLVRIIQTSVLSYGAPV